LIDTSLIDSLRAFLLAGDRKIDLWYQQEHYCTADFSDSTEIFTNINTPEELELASTTIQPPNYD
jgi:molybdopterin-guanine dinucleotide biosynthesis protein A